MYKCGKFFCLSVKKFVCTFFSRKKWNVRNEELNKDREMDVQIPCYYLSISPLVYIFYFCPRDVFPIIFHI